VPFFLIKKGGLWVAFVTDKNVDDAKDPIQYWGKTVTDDYVPVMKPYEELRSRCPFLLAERGTKSY
jgi:hypothetical protein